MEVPRGFTRCDECKGKGYGPWEEAIGPDRCLSCSGSGLVPTEKLQQEIRLVIRHYRVRDRSVSVPTVADAVLRKVAEHIREER